MTNGEVERDARRGEEKKEDANQMPTTAATSKASSVRPCHRRESAHRPRLYLNALSSGYATMTRARFFFLFIFWNPRKPTTRDAGRDTTGELFLEFSNEGHHIDRPRPRIVIRDEVEKPVSRAPGRRSFSQ